MSKDYKNRMNKRLLTVKVLMIASVFILAGKSFYIQIFQAEELATKAKKDYVRVVQIKGERGQIFDRSMNQLATSVEAASISACPANIEEPGKVARQLAQILGLNSRKLKKKLSSKRQFTWIVKKVSKDQAQRIAKLNIEGVYIEKDTKRIYPNKEVAAQVLGFTGVDNEGLEGLEFKYEKLLKGKTKEIRLTKAGKSGVITIAKEQRSQLKGKSLVLTIDKKIQYVSEQALQQAVQTHKGKSGIAIVMRPKTGELLSIAHYPKFNPNHFRGVAYETFKNRAVTDMFEPGSVIKVFTAASALEKGYSPRFIFFCENGSYKIGKYTIHDTHPHEWLSINQIIKFSSNIGAAKITETIGSNTLYESLNSFGFGKKTQVDCPGEISGSLLPVEKWTAVDTSAISFGQGMSVTAVQLLNGVSAIANDGVLMKPMLIKKVLSNTGEVEQEFGPQPVKQVVSKTTADHVKRMMNLVVQEDGTGTKAAMERYEVCGKTGTAQKAFKNKRGYSKTKYTAVFAGFAPKNNPELAILVVVDEPKPKHYGGEVAAPAFKTIMAESFNYLNIAPEKNNQMVAFVPAGDTN